MGRKSVKSEKRNRFEFQEMACTILESTKETAKNSFSYLSSYGVQWDAQPACFITNYVLAMQCFLFGGYALYYYQSVAIWYGLYFFAIGITAVAGAFLHHVAYKALYAFDGEKKLIRVFWMTTSQNTVDVWIESLWRVVLCFSSVSHFALVSLCSYIYFSESIAYVLTLSAAVCYVCFGIYAVVKMDTIWMFCGILPALGLLGYTSMMQLNESLGGWNGIAAVVFKLLSGVVQSLSICPSEKYFNHNALAHVLLSFAAMFMLFNV